MATFKVGQRVKVLPHPKAWTPLLFGHEGTIEALAVMHSNGHALHFVRLDVPVGGDVDWDIVEMGLAPLTDPKAEEFIERIKRIEREPNTLKDPAPNWDHA